MMERTDKHDREGNELFQNFFIARQDARQVARHVYLTQDVRISETLLYVDSQMVK